MAIKKDIAFGRCAIVESESVERDCNVDILTVDEVFESADRQIAIQNQQVTQSAIKKSTKKQPGVFKTVIANMLTIICCVIAIVSILFAHTLDSIMASTPLVQSSIYDGFVRVRDAALVTNDDLLTIDEYYQKRMILILSTDDAKAATDKLSNPSDLISSAMDDSIDGMLIPDDKKSTYEALLEEYQLAQQYKDAGYADPIGRATPVSPIKIQ